jgi:hypothetical protein
MANKHAVKNRDLNLRMHITFPASATISAGATGENGFTPAAEDGHRKSDFGLVVATGASDGRLPA